MTKKETSKLNIPNHVAIIPDGNRTWAKERGLPAIEGHRKGAEITRDLITKARDIGIHTLTLWGFSTENWNRSDSEIKYLMRIFEKTIKDNFEEAKKENVRIIHMGRRDRFPNSLKELILKVEEPSQSVTLFNFLQTFYFYLNILLSPFQILWGQNQESESLGNIIHCK